MPVFDVTSPEGKKFRVTAPEGATQDQVLERVRQHSQPQSYSLGEVPIAAATNLGSSAKGLVQSMAQPILHPINTLEGIGRLGAGAMSKLGIRPDQESEQAVDAVGQFFKDRYGGWEQTKRTIAEDPLGFAADISTVFTGGGATLSKIPKLAEMGEAASKVGRVTNPLTAVGKVAEKAPAIASQVIGNIGTGVGADALKQMASAGFKGGAASKAALENMRNPESFQSAIVANARKALNEVRMERSVAYQKGMQDIGQIQKPLKFDEIDKALSGAGRIKSFKGVPISKLAGSATPLPAEKTLTQIWSAVQQWKKLPDTFHTPSGFDALKQYVGEIKDGLQFGTPERKVAEEAYGAIRNTIVKQAPDYANVMKYYEKASSEIEELTKTLSLGKKTSEDTALRKLLSTTRSNVNTNFGKRAELAQELGKRDPTLVPSLAGQALSGWTPQGLAKYLAGGLGGAAALAHAPGAIAAAPFASPRLMGEAAHALGQGAGAAQRAIPPQVLQAIGKVNPDVLKQVLLLMSRGGQNAPQ